MRITKCDQCGATIEKCPTLRIKVELIRWGYEKAGVGRTLDLCQSCEDELYDFIFKKREEEKNGEQAQSQDPEQKNIQKPDV